MTHVLTPDAVTFRVLVVVPSSHKVLVQEDGGPLCVLRVSIAPRGRLAQELRRELGRLWDADVFILDFLQSGEDRSPLVVAELLPRTIPAELPTAYLDQIPEDEVSELERALFFRMLGRDANCPVSRIGWRNEAVAWAEDVTGGRLHAEAAVEQHNAGGLFTLLHLRMEDGQSYWLKATGEPNIHEREITRLLSTLCPRSLPHIVEEMPAWNAWLMKGDGCSLPALPTEPKRLVQLLRRAVESLAELQLASIGAESELFAAGAFDQRPHVLRANLDGLFAYLGEAMLLQSSTKVPRIGAGRLQEIREFLSRALDHAERLGIPSTIVHGDMNLGNLVFTEDSCHLIDWSEGYIGHPLVTFQHLLLLNPVENPQDKASVENALKEIYQTALYSVCDFRQIEEGFSCMALLAAFSTLYGRGDWQHRDPGNDPQWQRYARSITRYMDRYARDPCLLESLGVRSNG